METHNFNLSSCANIGTFIVPYLQRICNSFLCDFPNVRMAFRNVRIVKKCANLKLYHFFGANPLIWTGSIVKILPVHIILTDQWMMAGIEGDRAKR